MLFSWLWNQSNMSKIPGLGHTGPTNTTHPINHTITKILSNCSEGRSSWVSGWQGFVRLYASRRASQLSKIRCINARLLCICICCQTASQYRAMPIRRSVPYFLKSENEAG